MNLNQKAFSIIDNTLALHTRMARCTSKIDQNIGFQTQDCNFCSHPTTQKLHFKEPLFAITSTIQSI